MRRMSGSIWCYISDGVISGGRKALQICLLFGFLFVPNLLAQSTAKLRVAWDANNQEPDLAGYRIYYGPDSRGYTNYMAVGITTRAELPLLQPGTYYLAIVAVNHAGIESLYSNELTNRVPAIDENIPPTLDPVGDLNLAEDAGLQAVPLSGISPGGADDQIVTLSITNSNPGLIRDPRIIYRQGDHEAWLLFDLAPNAFGASTFTVTVDDGQSVNNSVSRSFAVNVFPVNDPPAISAIPDQILREDFASLPINFTISDAESPAVQVAVTARSSNPNLIRHDYVLLGTGTGSQRVMMLVPSLNQSGNADITLEARDPDGATSTATFSVQVIAVNDSPLISPIRDLVMDEDTAATGIAFSIFDAETPADRLELFPVSLNTNLIGETALIAEGTGASRTLSFVPVRNAYGSGLVQVWVMDEEGTFAHTVFEVKILPVNDVPVISPIFNHLLSEDTPSAPIPIIVSDVETDTADLIVTATSANPLVIGNEGLWITRTPTNRVLAITPRANQSGVAPIRVTVTDLNGASASVNFAVGVSAVNDPPGLDPLVDFTIDEGSPPILVPLFGIHSGASNELQTLSVTAVSSLPSVIPHPVVDYVSPNAVGSLLLSPLPDTNGTVVITVTVRDGQTANSVATSSFRVSVRSFNNPPIITSLPNLVTVRIPLPTEVIFNVQDSDSPAANLLVSGYSANQALLPNANLVFSGTAISRTLTIHPVPGRTGLTQVTVVVSDGDATVSVTFHVLVMAGGI